VDAVSLAEEGQVDVVVDDKNDPGGLTERAQASSQLEQVAPPNDLLAELEDVGAAAQGCGGQVGEAVGLLVRGDDVEVRREEATQEGLSDGPVNLPSREAARRTPTGPRLREAHLPASGEEPGER
jgi:hypothetical protein